MTREKTVWLAFAVVASGCAHVPPMALQPPGSTTASCRRVVGDDAVRWIGPDAARDRAKLDAWCETIGPVVVHREAAADREAPSRLVIVSWNVHVGGGDVRALLTRLRDGALTRGEPVDRFIVLLQEAFRKGDDVPRAVAPGAAVPHRIAPRPASGERLDVREIAAAEHLSFVYVPAMRNGDAAPAEDRGNAILATEPLGRVTVIELPMEHQRRVAVAAAIAVQPSPGDRNELLVVDTHLDTGLALTRGGPMAARHRQVQALVDALEDVSQGDTVIGGDFNSWFGDAEPAVQELRRTFAEHATPETPTWHGAGGVRATLDHMFARIARGEAVTSRVPERFGSDHDPLVTTVRWH